MLQTQRLLDFFISSVKIPSPSLREKKFADFLYNTFLGLADKLVIDQREKGANIIAQFNGDPTKEGIVLCAHMDTVEDGLKPIDPIIDGNRIWSNSGTILGADNKAAIAIFMEAILAIQEHKKAHRPIDLLLTFGEEAHLYGIKEFDTKLLRFNKVLLLDASGKVGGIVLSSPTHYSFKLNITGKKAHAGIEPEKGLNAIYQAAQIIQRLPNGRIDEETTFNIGMIRGGEATNIVPDKVCIEGEFRSTVDKKVQDLIDKIMKINIDFPEVKIDLVKDYIGYNLSYTEPFIQSIIKVMEKKKIIHYFVHSGGGSDANILKEKGFDVLNLTSGMMKPHTLEEYIEIDDLITGTELIISYLTNE